jgi:FtsP/CotA-like multicopper oxidase with cupredoxin domain
LIHDRYPTPGALTRRAALVSGGVCLAGLPLLAAAQSAGPARDGRLADTRIGNRPVTLTAAERRISLLPGTTTLVWLFGERPFPVLRLRRGEVLDVTLENRLDQHSAIHWHGVRGPNAMDGVPYLTQPPVEPGERFRYRFTPPDAGTYFFHPHCNTAEQLGRGLLGALIVEDEAEQGFADDVVLVLKDWRLADDGGFLPFLTPQTASRAGAFGTLRTVNGLHQPNVAIAGGEVRLRLINADPSRICALGVTGGEAMIIAIDGAPVTPFALDRWRFAPGMRLDLAVRPGGEGRIVLLDDFAADPEILATLTSKAPAEPAAPPVSYGQPAPVLDVAKAARHSLELGAGVASAPDTLPQPIVLPDGRRIDLADSLCLAAGSFWTIDGQSWPERDHRHLPPPLMKLERGQTVVLEFFNATPRAHPMHVHGHTMTILSASRLKRPVHRADTVLVMPNERVEAAFVADNPGAWMIHCHVIEHQETGMMGWFLVS